MTLELMSLPMELHLAIQSHLPLSALLTARAVCKAWHSLIPGSHIPSPRLRLLKLYLHAVHSPAFLATRESVSKRLEDFDREKMLRSIEKGTKGESVPEEFAIWLTEWPAKAVFGGIWPGLRCVADDDKELGGEVETLHKPRGKFLFTSRRPVILNQLRITPTQGEEDNVTTEMVVVPSWVSVPPAQRSMALVLDDAYVNGWQRSTMVVLSSPELAGKVYQIDGIKGRADQPIALGWAEYLEKELDREEKWIVEHPITV